MFNGNPDMLESTALGQFIGSLLSFEVLVLLSFVYLLYNVISYMRSPLSRLPGNWYSRFSRVDEWWTILSGQLDYNLKLHQRYGRVVRTGYNRVSVADPDSLRVIYGSHRFQKSRIYSMLRHPRRSGNVFTLRDPDEHKLRKRLVAPSYSQSTVNSMESDIRNYGINKMMEQLHKHAMSGKPVDFLPLMRNMTADVICQVAFGIQFNALENGTHPLKSWLEQSMLMSLYRIAMPGFEFFRLLGVFDKRIKEEEKLIDFTKQLAKQQRNSPTGQSTVLQMLADATDHATGEQLDDDALGSEAFGQFAAGSETTAITLSWTLQLLMENPHCMEKLAEELKTIFPDVNTITNITHEPIANLPYLNAVLHESMRIRPAVGGGLPRQVPEGGVTFCGHFIPGGTTVSSDAYTIHHCEDFWPEPEKFLPERWLVPPEELSKMKRAFIPFSIGPRACLGRALAWTQTRLALAAIIRRFSLEMESESPMKPIASFILRSGGNKMLGRVTLRD